MIIHLKEKTWCDKNIKIRFAFIPLALSDQYGYIWLGRYYYYCNCKICWRAPYSQYKNKEEFLRKVVEAK